MSECIVEPIVILIFVSGNHDESGRGRPMKSPLSRQYSDPSGLAAPLSPVDISANFKQPDLSGILYVVVVVVFNLHSAAREKNVTF